MSEITLLLSQCRANEAGARDRLYALLYPELKRLARSHLARSGPMTLDPSAIVHDAWLRCEGAVPPGSRGQFFGYASAVMRSVIVDHVRERAADKRGGGLQAVTLSTAALDALPAQAGALEIDEALAALERADPRAHQMVEMRYFGGMTLEEIAEVMGVSVPTLKRDWRRARAFLYDFLSG
ncbi:ECF-type sigma factor [Ideonella sp. A 288]|uniref:ECF-type sigma factor n=1 Tax=Ideonella sp. A 288 TaxID=1962181 RepID=UPI000B4B541D|nr:ECF-type sigma factor [Ideonella sp. A 288]